MMILLEISDNLSASKLKINTKTYIMVIKLNQNIIEQEKPKIILNDKKSETTLESQSLLNKDNFFNLFLIISLLPFSHLILFIYLSSIKLDNLVIFILCNP